MAAWETKKPRVSMESTAIESTALAGDATARVMTRQPSIENIMAAGPWKLARPRVRKDWAGKNLRGQGMVTKAETLFLVMISMGIAKSRNQLMLDHDLVWYILHFFSLWNVLYSCITYASRFNDADAWHTMMWSCVTIGLLFQVSCINVNLFGFGVATCALNSIIGVACFRAAVYLPRARVFCIWFGATSFIGALVCACLCMCPPRSDAVRALLWVNVFLGPVSYTLWKVLVFALDKLYPGFEEEATSPLGWDAEMQRNDIASPSLLEVHSAQLFEGDVHEVPGYGTSCHVPSDVAYLISRHEATHLMIIACSFLAPIAEQGNIFATNTESMVIVFLGNCFAILLKLTVLDIDNVKHKGSDLARHPLNRGGIASRVFLLLFPASVIGIALTGVGFVMAILEASSPSAGSNLFLARSLLCFAPAVTSFVLMVNKILTAPKARLVAYKWAKIACIAVCIVAFLVPAALQASLLTCSICTVSIQLLICISQILLERAVIDSARNSEIVREVPSYGVLQWALPTPRRTWHEEDKMIGSRVSSHEQFITTLVSVAVLFMNRNLIETHDLLRFLVDFFTFYASLAMTIKYASLFKLDDLSHKGIWSIYQFVLLLQLEGLWGYHRGLFTIASAVIFLCIGVFFWLRAALVAQRANGISLYYMIVCVALALVFIVRYLLLGTSRFSLDMCTLFALVFISFFAEPLLDFVMSFWVDEERRKEYTVPTDVEYVVNRFHGLLMQCMGAAVLIPNAVYPGGFAHPSLVIMGLVLVGVMPMLFKIAFFNSDTISAQRHAILQSNWRAIAFMHSHPITLLCQITVGGAMAMLVRSLGEEGVGAYAPFAQHLLSYASALFWASEAWTKMLHKAKHPRLHHTKAAVALAGGLSSLVPVICNQMGSLATLAYIVALFAVIDVLQMLSNVAVEHGFLVNSEYKETLKRGMKPAKSHALF